MRAALATVESHLSHSDDPLRTIQTLADLALRPEEYDRLIPALETRCIDRIQLLEKYEILLRGDCHRVNEDIVRFYANNTLGATHQAQRDLSTPSSRLTALGALLGEIVARNNVAKHYERRQIQSGAHDEVTPYLIFGFRAFPGEPPSAIDPCLSSYFTGHGDDIGERFSNVRAFPLRSSPGDTTEVFPQIDITVAVPPGRAPITSAGTRRIRRFDTTEYAYASNFTFILQRSDSYFDALLYAHAILSSLEQFASRRVSD